MAVTRGDSRARILDTAWGLVRERGIDAVTVADIAAATGVSRQLLYVHFENRAGLLKAMARRHDVRSGFAGRAAETSSLPPVAALERLLRLWPTSPRSSLLPGRWRRPPSTATRAAWPGATAWATCGRCSLPPSTGSPATAAWPPAGPRRRPPTGSGRRPAVHLRPPGPRPRLAGGRLHRPGGPVDPVRGGQPRRTTNSDRAEVHTRAGAVPSPAQMSPGPRPNRVPVETGSGPPRVQWQSLRAFVAGGDGGLVRPHSRSAHGHVQEGTRPLPHLPPTRGRKPFRPLVEAPADGLRPGRRLRCAPFRLAPSSSTGGGSLA